MENMEKRLQMAMLSVAFPGSHFEAAKEDARVELTTEQSDNASLWLRQNLADRS